jgi:hypothetical protein
MKQPEWLMTPPRTTHWQMESPSLSVGLGH